MEYVYAAMLLHKAGKDVSEENVQKVLEAAGVEADSSRIKALTVALEGVDIDEAIKSAAPMAAAPTAAAPSEEKKEEQKEEEEEDDGEDEEQAAAGMGALFG